MKTRVLLITENYPFPPGEQFLDDEVKYWGARQDVELTIAPLNARGGPREVPGSVLVDTALAIRRRSLMHYVQGLASPLLLRECFFLLRRKSLFFVGLKEAIKVSVRVQQAFASLMEQGKQYDIIYCYWNDVGAYAAALSKRNGKCTTLISRAHGFDLYEERRAGNNLPLKRQFVADFDRVFVISEQARNYFLSTFGAAKVDVSRLGVPVGGKMSPPSPAGSMRILSVSFCVPVKRIDRICDGVALFARMHPGIQVEWMHMGDGPLRTALMEKAATAIREIHNLQVNFPGDLPNHEVRRRMAEESWDVLINASESEGVPVSIMEAMSFGIPAIATHVGGVAELVDMGRGMLLKPDAAGDEISAAIAHVSLIVKSAECRAACKEKVNAEFNSRRNYLAFLDMCLALKH